MAKKKRDEELTKGKIMTDEKIKKKRIYSPGQFCKNAKEGKKWYIQMLRKKIISSWHFNATAFPSRSPVLAIREKDFGSFQKYLPGKYKIIAEYGGLYLLEKL